jgi:hypothetical protein
LLRQKGVAVSERDDHGSKRVLPFIGGPGVPPIAGGGGGPHDPGMDARVTRLEDQYGRIETLLRAIDDRMGRIDDRVGRIEDRVEQLGDRVRHIEIDVAELKGRIVNLPTTWAMITTMIGGQIALAGILLAAFRFAGVH